MDRKIIEDAIKSTKGIPGFDNKNGDDVLVPLQLEEANLTPYPEIEYKIIEATTLDKVVRDVNTQLSNGWQTEGGVQVVSNGATTRFYQSMIRWNVDANVGLKPEMPCENSEGDTQGPKPLYIPGLEDEPDLYEDTINNEA